MGWCRRLFSKPESCQCRRSGLHELRCWRRQLSQQPVMYSCSNRTVHQLVMHDRVALVKRQYSGHQTALALIQWTVASGDHAATCMSESAGVMPLGCPFQIWGAATAKDLLPAVESLTGGTIRQLELADWNGEVEAVTYLRSRKLRHVVINLCVFTIKYHGDHASCNLWFEMSVCCWVMSLFLYIWFAISAGASGVGAEGPAPTRTTPPPWAGMWPAFFLMYPSLCAPLKLSFTPPLLTRLWHWYCLQCVTCYVLPLRCAQKSNSIFLHLFINFAEPKHSIYFAFHCWSIMMLKLWQDWWLKLVRFGLLISLLLITGMMMECQFAEYMWFDRSWWAY